MKVKLKSNTVLKTELKPSLVVRNMHLLIVKAVISVCWYLITADGY